MRRGNVQILDFHETLESSSTTAVVKLLMEGLQLDEVPLSDCSHRTQGVKMSGDKPRVIVAKLNHYQDCVK